jgi:hypothetical protein
MNRPEEKPTETAEFWLGQVAAIDRLERSGRMTKAQAMKEINKTMKNMQHQLKTNNATKSTT